MKSWVAIAAALVALALAWRFVRSPTAEFRPRRAGVAPAPHPPRPDLLLSAELPLVAGSSFVTGKVVGPQGPVAGAIVVATPIGGPEALSAHPCACDDACGTTLLHCDEAPSWRS